MIPGAIDLDAAIATIQSELSALAWLAKAFGRAKMLPTRDIEGKTKLEPKVYQGGGEYYPVLPNDALQSYSFCRVWGDREIDHEKSGSTFNYGSVILDVIFWVNLQSINPAKDYIFTEELINEAFKVFNRCPGVSVAAVVDEKTEDIFRGYSLNTEQRDLLMFPYQAFRFELALDYEVTC